MARREFPAFPLIDAKETGANIRRLRQACGLSVRDVQAYYNFTAPQSVYRWEAGGSLPTLENMYALHVLLHVPMEEIIAEGRSFLSTQQNEVLTHF